MTPPAGAGPVPISGGPVPPLPLAPLDFCIPPNPTVGVLRSHAELGLRKLRSGRNISGILREVPAYAAPTDTVTGMPVAVNGQIILPSVRAVPPTAYRYSVLIARVKELAQQAAQIEPQYLAAIEKLTTPRSPGCRPARPSPWPAPRRGWRACASTRPTTESPSPSSKPSAS